MRYPRPEPGEWVKPTRRNYKLACCSCGLVHSLDFRLIDNDHGKGKMIQFRADIDNRATGQMRRWMKNNGT